MMRANLVRDSGRLALLLLIGCASPVCAETGASSEAVTSSDLVTPLNPLARTDRTILKSFVERPLFEPARRLPSVDPVVVAPPVVAPAPDPPPPTLQLLGVVHGARDMAIARRDGEQTIFLHTGDQISGWTVTILPPMGIRLQDGARAFAYVLFGKPSDARPVPVETTAGSDSLLKVQNEMAARNARLQKRPLE